MTIEPISELKNYNSLLENVKDGEPIYLTKNGKGVFAILSISDVEDFNKYKINEQFKKDIKKSVEDEDFFIKDVEDFYKEVEEAIKDAEENPKRYGAELFDELRRELDA